MTPGKSFTAPVPGWFVPDARMIRIVDDLDTYKRMLEQKK